MRILSLFVILVGFILFSCEDLDPSIDVEYRVTGSAGKVDVTYENEDGGVSQQSNVTVPWSYKFEARDGDFVYISAQNQGSYGTVIVTIFKNGGEFKSSTSTGAYVIATASGSL